MSQKKYEAYPTISLNEFRFIGRVASVKTEEISGSTKLSFGLAVDETTYNANNERVVTTQFINCHAWNPSPSIAAIATGDKLFVRGKVVVRNYMKDDKKVYVTEFKARTIDKLSVGASNGTDTQPDMPDTEDAPTEPPFVNASEDDLPF